MMFHVHLPNVINVATTVLLLCSQSIFYTDIAYGLNLPALVRFNSSDSHLFEVPFHCAMQSLVIQNMFEHVSQVSDSFIFQLDFHSITVKNVLDLLYLDQEQISESMKHYEFEDLIEMFKLMDYLHIHVLLEHANSRLGNMILERRYGQPMHNLALLYDLPDNLIFAIVKKISWGKLTLFLESAKLECNIEASEPHLGNFLLQYVTFMVFYDTEKFEQNCPCMVNIESARFIDLESKHIKKLTSCSSFKNLKELSLARNSINDETLQFLTESDTFIQLKILDLRDNLIGSKGAEAIAKSPFMKNLRELNLNRNNVSDAGVQELSISENMKFLEVLRLQGNEIGVNGGHAIAASTNFESLIELNLDSNQLHDDGVIAISNSKYLKNLGSLHLSNNGIGVEGAKALALSENLKYLQVLNLRYNQIGDEGAMSLFESEITANLNLERNGIGNAVALAISKSRPQHIVGPLERYD